MAINIVDHSCMTMAFSKREYHILFIQDVKMSTCLVIYHGFNMLHALMKLIAVQDTLCEKSLLLCVISDKNLLYTQYFFSNIHFAIFLDHAEQFLQDIYYLVQEKL